MGQLDLSKSIPISGQGTVLPDVLPATFTDADLKPRLADTPEQQLIEYKARTAAKALGFDPHIAAAIALRESNLGTNTTSPTGVKGPMQVSGVAAKDVGMDPANVRSNTDANIIAGILYAQKHGIGAYPDPKDRAAWVPAVEKTAASSKAAEAADQPQLDLSKSTPLRDLRPKIDASASAQDSVPIAAGKALGQLPIQGGQRYLSTEQQALGAGERGTADLLSGQGNLKQYLAMANPLTLPLAAFLGNTSNTGESLKKGLQGKLPNITDLLPEAFVNKNPKLSAILATAQDVNSPTLSAAAPIIGQAANPVPSMKFGSNRVGAALGLQEQGINAPITPGQANPRALISQRLESLFPDSLGSAGPAKENALAQEAALKGNPETGAAGATQVLQKMVGTAETPAGQPTIPLNPEDIHSALQQGHQAMEAAAKSTYDPLYQQVRQEMGNTRFTPESTSETIQALQKSDLPKPVATIIKQVSDVLGFKIPGKIAAQDLTGYTPQEAGGITFGNFWDASKKLNSLMGDFYTENPTSEDLQAIRALKPLQQAMRTDLGLMSEGRYPQVPQETAAKLQQANKLFGAVQDATTIGPEDIFGRQLSRNFNSPNSSAQTTSNIINKMINGNQYEALGKYMMNLGPDAAAPIQHMAATDAIMKGFDVSKMSEPMQDLVFGPNGKELIKNASIYQEATKAAEAEMKKSGFSVFKTLRIPTMVGSPVGLAVGTAAHALGVPAHLATAAGVATATSAGIPVMRMLAKAYYNPTVMRLLTTGTPASKLAVATQLLVPIMMHHLTSQRPNQPGGAPQSILQQPLSNYLSPGGQP